jgi:hypothetical protein
MRSHPSRAGAQRPWAHLRRATGALPPPCPPFLTAPSASSPCRHRLAVGLTLRSLCYDPIIEGALIRPAGGEQQQQQAQQQQQGQAQQQEAQQQEQQQQSEKPPPAAAAAAGSVSRSRRLRTVATAFVFLMSGLAHELMFWYIMAPEYVPGTSLFFFVQVGGSSWEFAGH